MKLTVLVPCAAALMSTVAGAQQSGASAERRAIVEVAGQAGGAARVALETRVTRGKPYTGEAVTEFVQVLGDGNRIVRTTASKLYRDSEGRTRRETTTETGAAAAINSVVITDPVAGTSLILDAGTKTAIKASAMFARVQGGTITSMPGNQEYTITTRGPGERGEVTAAAGPRENRKVEMPPELAERVAQSVTTFSSADGAMMIPRSGGPGTKEDLGEQLIEGVMAKGTRTTTVIPAGAIGNEQPITTVSEQWFSADLEVLVLTKHSDPRVGETTYRLTNITRTEPDRALFQAPADYTVQERPGRPPIRMLRQQ